MTRKLSFKIAIIAMTGLLMGNQACQPENRVLRRKIQLGQIEAPAMALPDEHSSFDFQAATNAEAYDLLKRAQAFSLIKIDPIKIYDSDGLPEVEFNRCFSPGESWNLGLDGACVTDYPHGVISGHVRGFQLSAAKGTPLTLKNISLMPTPSYEFRHYEVAVKLSVTDPFYPGQVVATNSEDHFGNDTGKNVRLSLAGFSTDPKAYFNSPLRKVVDDGITQAIADLKTQWEKVSPWYAVVLKSCDNQIYINGGSKTGLDLRVGDILRVQKVAYRWSGAACSSTLQGATVSDDALAWVTVTAVGESISTAKIIENDSRYPQNKTEPIRPGFRLYIEKLQ